MEVFAAVEEQVELEFYLAACCGREYIAKT